jgi:hypothetical protein
MIDSAMPSRAAVFLVKDTAHARSHCEAGTLLFTEAGFI